MTVVYRAYQSSRASNSLQAQIHQASLFVHYLDDEKEVWIATHMLLFDVVTANWRRNESVVSALIIVSSCTLEAIPDLPQHILLAVQAQGELGALIDTAKPAP